MLENALRHTPRAGRVLVTCDLHDHRVRIRVEDTGPGISAQQASRIFEHFYRRGSGDESGGVGLGLAIGRRIAELHGARLTLDSSPDKGATFSFTLSPAP